jgi:hypothetical protein
MSQGVGDFGPMHNDPTFQIYITTRGGDYDNVVDSP